MESGASVSIPGHLGMPNSDGIVSRGTGFATTRAQPSWRYGAGCHGQAQRRREDAACHGHATADRAIVVQTSGRGHGGSLVRNACRHAHARKRDSCSRIPRSRGHATQLQTEPVIPSRKRNV